MPDHAKHTWYAAEMDGRVYLLYQVNGTHTIYHLAAECFDPSLAAEIAQAMRDAEAGRQRGAGSETAAGEGVGE